MIKLNRRDFLATAVVGGAASALVPAPSPAGSRRDSETLVAHLFKTLREDQKKVIAFPFTHPLRSKVDNNWRITPARIGTTLDPDQQAMVREIFRGLHAPDFVERAFQQLEDDGGGIENYSPAFFGDPGTGKFEFVLTGRHRTVRCDGDSIEGAAFGGPIFYGHEGEQFYEKPSHPGNIYWHQALRANEVFRALDHKQRKAALLSDARPEQASKTVSLGVGEPQGLPVAEMSRDQRELVERVLADLLRPFRERDRLESMRLIRENGGVDALSMAFFRNHDLGGDGVWDVWQLESPTMIWHFRGAPHVHVWVNIQDNPDRRKPA